MSGRYRLTPKAADDLKAINDYTARQWGNEQRR
ncbi:MAG: type II toxin-antitoxin system RelE/ParE family toxin, partial [Allorhizobium sp.]